MRIGGIIDVSTKDIPHKSAMVIFTVGCNLSCGFCHNKHLLDPEIGQEVNVDNIINRIKSNVLVSAVSISGGEPTLQRDILQLCQGIMDIGKYLSLDTNGTKPRIIEALIPYLDRIALDVKAPFNDTRLKEITNGSIHSRFIQSTIKLINKETIDFEIRTTYVGKLMNLCDIEKIITDLKDINFKGNFVLQQYQYSEGVMEDYKALFQKPDHNTLLSIIKPYKDSDLPFKIFLRDDIVGYDALENL